MALTNFIPSTGGGRFDAELFGDTLKIGHKFLLVNDLTKAVTEGEYETFKEKFKQLIKQHWQDKFGFKLEARTVRAKFKLSFIDDDASAATAHYVVNLRDGKGGNENVSRKPAMRFQNLANAGVYFPASTSLFKGSVEATQSSGLIANEIAGTYAPQQGPQAAKLFPFYVDVVGGVLSQQSQQVLKQFLGQIAKLSPALGIEVTGYGQGAGQVQNVIGILRGTGLTNVSSRKSKKVLQPKFWGTTSSSKWSGRSDYVKVGLGGQVPAESFQMSNLFSYPAAIVHEYGHMLGLMDEYACLSDQAATRMVDLDFIDASEHQAYANNHAAGARVDKDELAAGQAAFIQLCKDAGVTPTHFGRQTSSIMASGSEYMACHFVTLWEALTNLTGDDRWKIVKL